MTTPITSRRRHGAPSARKTAALAVRDVRSLISLGSTLVMAVVTTLPQHGPLAPLRAVVGLAAALLAPGAAISLLCLRARQIDAVLRAGIIGVGSLAWYAGMGAILTTTGVAYKMPAVVLTTTIACAVVVAFAMHVPAPQPASAAALTGNGRHVRRAVAGIATVCAGAALVAGIAFSIGVTTPSAPFTALSFSGNWAHLTGPQDTNTESVTVPIELSGSGVTSAAIVADLDGQEVAHADLAVGRPAAITVALNPQACGLQRLRIRLVGGDPTADLTAYLNGPVSHTRCG